MRAEIAEVGRSEERVAERVDEGIRVRMPREPERVVDAHPAENERPPRDEGMNVIADADAK